MLTSSVASLNFGAILVGVSASLSFTLTNTGKANINIEGITDVSNEASAFTIAADCPVLHPGHSCTVTVTFRPTAAGPYLGTLQVPFFPPQSLLRIPVSGSGLVPKHKETKEVKDTKEAHKEAKELAKDHKDIKEGKETKETAVEKIADKVGDKNLVLETKHAVIERIPTIGVPQPAAAEAPETAASPTQHSFITPEERPNLGPVQPPKDDSEQS